MVSVVIDIDGDYDEDVISRMMTILGELIINEVKSLIVQMDLISKTGGSYLQGWMSSYSNNVLTIENIVPYAVFLEYGTFGYWSEYGEDSFPDSPHPKKKDIPKALRDGFPSGMQPFAPVRRVMYNESKMSELVNIALANAV